MTDTTEQKALALVNEVRKDCGWQPHLTLSRHDCSRTEALCRAIEQHEAFRQEVSDAVERAVDDCGHDGLRKAYIHARFFHFIIAKPDPLVEALAEATGQGENYIDERDAAALRAAIEKRGGKIVWGEG